MINNKTIDIEDGKEYTPEEAMKLACHICGEWLQWDATVGYDFDTDEQFIKIKSASCGEEFRLVPIGFRAEIKSGLSELL